MDDTMITHEAILPGDYSSHKVTCLHRFRLRFLQSEIHPRFSANFPTSTPPSREWFDSVVQRLGEWQSTLPTGTNYCTTEWWTTKYHLTLIYLYRPSPGNPEPDQDALGKALMSAGIVMKSYRDQYRKNEINLSALTPCIVFDLSRLMFRQIG